MRRLRYYILRPFQRISYQASATLRTHFRRSRYRRILRTSFFFFFFESISTPSAPSIFLIVRGTAADYVCAGDSELVGFSLVPDITNATTNEYFGLIIITRGIHSASRRLSLWPMVTHRLDFRTPRRHRKWLDTGHHLDQRQLAPPPRSIRIHDGSHHDARVHARGQVRAPRE